MAEADLSLQTIRSQPQTFYGQAMAQPGTPQTFRYLADGMP
jgi:hypothetical protein